MKNSEGVEEKETEDSFLGEEAEIQGWCRSHWESWNNGKGMRCNDSPGADPVEGPPAREQQTGTLEESTVQA